MDLGLIRFNSLPTDPAASLVRDCLDHEDWFGRISEGRPFVSRQHLRDAAVAVLESLTEDQLRSVIACRSRLGVPAQAHSLVEQSEVQVGGAVADDLAALQSDYELRFGMKIMVRAAGRDAAQLVREVRRRLAKSPEEEWLEIRRELADITSRRLERALDELDASARPAVVIVNPNSSAPTTALLRDVAHAHLGLHLDFDLLVWQPEAGPALLATPGDLAASVSRIIGGVTKIAEALGAARLRGVVVAAIGDPAVASLRDLLDVPVVGIGESAMRLASRGGRSFSIITTTPALAGPLVDLATATAEPGTFVAIRLVDGSVTQGPLGSCPSAGLIDRLSTAVERTVAEDCVEAVVIGGGPLAMAARRLRAPQGAAIIEPLPAALDEIVARIGP